MRETKDEINFHGLLRKTRRYRGVTLENLSYGICSISNLHYYETGERVPDYQIRNRLMSRLGISSEDFEDYVNNDEYILFRNTLSLRDAYLNNRLEEVEDCLLFLKKHISDDDKILQQFILVVEANVCCKKKESTNVILEYYCKALEKTVSDFDLNKIEQFTLSPEELGIIERVVYYKAINVKNKSEKVFFEHKKNYESIISYSEKCFWDKNIKQKILSTVLVNYYDLFAESMSTKEKSEMILRTDRIINMIRESGRIYKIDELLTIKESLDSKNDIWGCNVKIALENVLKVVGLENFENEAMDILLFDFSTVYSISDVIKIRRRMLGLSRKKLAEGICSEKTLERIEKGRTNPQQFIVNLLFEKLNLNCVYRRFEIITDELSVNNLYKAYKKAINCSLISEADGIRRAIIGEIDTTIKQNQQVLARITNVCNKKMNKVSEVDFKENIRKTLSITLPIETITESEKLFLTLNEKLLIYYLAAFGDNKCRKIIENIVDNKDGSYIYDGNLGFYNIILNWLASTYGNEDNYSASCKITKWNVNLMLIYRRIIFLPNEIYNLLWIQMREEKVDREYIDNAFFTCITLSRFFKREKQLKFYQESRKRFIEQNYAL